MSTRQSLLAFLLAVAGLLVGCDESSWNRITFEFDEEVREARKSGNPDVYRAALLQFATQREIQALNEIFVEAALTDAMRAFYKLSLLESELGRKDEAQRYLLRSKEICNSFRDSCTEDDLSEYESRFDEFEREKGLQW